MKVLIVIPAYNEEKNLAGLLDKLNNTCPDYDVVVINDCSKDSTADICSKNNTPVINLPVNLGIGGAVQAGYKYAFYNGYDAAVQVDGDGQHDPEYIRRLVGELEKGFNMCIGSRFINMEKDSFLSTPARRAGIKYFSTLIYIFTGKTVKDPTSGFRACDKKAIELFARDYPRDYPEPEAIVNLKRQRLSLTEIPVIMARREGGKSSITNGKSVYYLIKVSLAIVIASFYKYGNDGG